MGIFGEILGSLLVVFVFLIGLWLLNGGREWCRRQLRFVMCAAEMPGPTALPLIGNAFYFAFSKGETLKKIVELAKPFNTPFRFWMGSKLFVGIGHPRDIEVVMNSPIATNKHQEYHLTTSYMGQGATGHRFRRNLFLPMLNGKSLDSFFDCFDRQTKKCVEILAQRVDHGKFDIMNYTRNCILDVILETLIGTTGTAQQGEYKDLTDCLSRVSRLSYERAIKFWLHPDWIHNLTKNGQQFSSDVKKLHVFTDDLVSRKKKKISDLSDDSDSQGEDLGPVLDQLTTHNGENKKLIDTEMRDEITNLWFAALDPTALTISFLIVMLGMHPEVQEKVRAELREVVGDEDVTLDHLAKLNYLEMVLKETLRLFPVVPVLLRRMEEDLDFETCTAPKGCTVALFLYMVHRDTKYWEEPDKFHPDRFTSENSAGRHPFAYLPFGHGVTECVGENYAMVLMKTLAANIIKNYRIIHEGSLETFGIEFSDFIRSTDGYNVSIAKI